MSKSKNSLGFIDPISLFAVVVLLVSLTLAVPQVFKNQNINEKAAGGCTLNPSQCKAGKEECVNGVCKAIAGTNTNTGSTSTTTNTGSGDSCNSKTSSATCTGCGAVKADGKSSYECKWLSASGTCVESANLCGGSTPTGPTASEVVSNSYSSCSPSPTYAWCGGCGGFCIKVSTTTCSQEILKKCGEITPTATCTAATVNAIAIYTGVGDYKKCTLVNGQYRWESCPTCTLADLTIIPAYLESQVAAAKLAATPTPTPSPSPTPKPTPTPTKSPSPTPKPTATPTKSPSPTPKPTVKPTATPTKSPSPTPKATQPSLVNADKWWNDPTPVPTPVANIVIPIPNGIVPPAPTPKPSLWQQFINGDKWWNDPTPVPTPVANIVIPVPNTNVNPNPTPTPKAIVFNPTVGSKDDSLKANGTQDFCEYDFECISNNCVKFPDGIKHCMSPGITEGYIAQTFPVAPKITPTPKPSFWQQLFNRPSPTPKVIIPVPNGNIPSTTKPTIAPNLSKDDTAILIPTQKPIAFVGTNGTKDDTSQPTIIQRVTTIFNGTNRTKDDTIPTPTPIQFVGTNGTKDDTVTPTVVQRIVSIFNPTNRTKEDTIPTATPIQFVGTNSTKDDTMSPSIIQRIINIFNPTSGTKDDRISTPTPIAFVGTNGTKDDTVTPTVVQRIVSIFNPTNRVKDDTITPTTPSIWQPFINGDKWWNDPTPVPTPVANIVIPIPNGIVPPTPIDTRPHTTANEKIGYNSVVNTPKPSIIETAIETVVNYVSGSRISQTTPFVAQPVKTTSEILGDYFAKYVSNLFDPKNKPISDTSNTAGAGSKFGEIVNPNVNTDSTIEIPTKQNNAVIPIFEMNSPQSIENKITQPEKQNPILNYADVGLGGQRLPPEFYPPDLTNIETVEGIFRSNNIYLNIDATTALSNFAKYAQSQGYTLYISSGYRSYEEQAMLHVENPNGAAVAGDSQHQTGLAMDLYIVELNGNGESITIEPIPDILINKAPDFGIAHPISWDRPHFFVVAGLGIDTSGIDLVADSIEDYIQLNEAIQDAQNINVQTSHPSSNEN